MIKRLFDWTPRDIAAWEKIRGKGFRHFVGWYGVAITGGGLFIFLGGATFLIWLGRTLGDQAGLTGARWLFLALQLLFVVLFCLVGGIINSLITWAVEERLYRKYKPPQVNQS